MKNVNIFIGLGSILLLGLLQSNCYYDKETDRAAAVCDTATVSYSAQIVPILAANCYSCHAVATNVAQSPFETYGTLLDYVDQALVHSLKGTGGYNIMPPSGVVSACEIEKIEAWVRAGALNN